MADRKFQQQDHRAGQQHLAQWQQDSVHHLRSLTPQWQHQHLVPNPLDQQQPQCQQYNKTIT